MLTDSEKARAIAVAAFRLHDRLESSGNTYTTSAQHRLLELCNAVIDLIDDGDCLTQREILMDELRCDEGGNPLGPEADLVPFALCKPLDQQVTEARAAMGADRWQQLNSEWSKP